MDRKPDTRQPQRHRNQQHKNQEVQKWDSQVRLFSNQLVEKNDNRSTRQNAQCSLCSTKYKAQQMVVVGRCKHQCCQGCFEQYIRVQIGNKNRITCPIHQCEEIIQPIKYAHFILNLSQNYSEQLEFQLENGQQQLQMAQQKDNQIHKKQIPFPSHISPVKQQQLQIMSPLRNIQSDYSKLKQRNKQLPLPSKNSIGSIFQSGQVMIQPDHQQQKPQVKDKNQHLLPYILFQFLCSRVWSNKWSRFFFMLPLSIIILCLFLLLITLWAIWICFYFTLIWLIFVPFIWAITEVWECFTRSFENPTLRVIMFVFCLIAFPIIEIFFYFVIVGLIIYYKLYNQDMRQVLCGKSSYIISLRKISMRPRQKDNEKNSQRNNQKIVQKSNQKTAFNCRCSVHSNCEYCQGRKSILCLVF